MRDYFANRELDPELRDDDVPMPHEARTLALAERFHMWPGEIESKPIDEVLRWTSVLSVEGEVLAARAGLPADERVVFEGEDD